MDAFGPLVGLTNLAARLYRRFVPPKPRLRLTVNCTGGGSGIDFTALISEVGNQVPALGCTVRAELEGVPPAVYVSQPFNLSAGQLDHSVRFKLERPRYGELVKACGDAATLYGRSLTVTVEAERGASTKFVWDEERFSPDTDAARHEAMQRVWAEHAAATENP